MQSMLKKNSKAQNRKKFEPLIFIYNFTNLNFLFYIKFLKSLNEILFHLGEKTSLKIEIFLTCAKIIEC